MTKRVAIKLIQIQKDKVEEYGDDMIWIHMTMSRFESIFGKESSEYAIINTFSRGLAKPNPNDVMAFNEWKLTIGRLTKLLDEAILTIKNEGVRKEPKVDFEKRFFNKINIYAICAAFLLGYIIGAFDNPKSVITHIFKEINHIPDSSSTLK